MQIQICLDYQEAIMQGRQYTMQLLAVFDVIAGQGVLDTTYLDLHKA